MSEGKYTLPNPIIGEILSYLPDEKLQSLTNITNDGDRMSETAQTVLDNREIDQERDIVLGHLENIHVNTGYRQGLESTEEELLEIGFHQGYASGSLHSYRLGIDRGMATALVLFEQMKVKKQNSGIFKGSNKSVVNSVGGKIEVMGVDVEVDDDIDSNVLAIDSNLSSQSISQSDKLDISSSLSLPVVENTSNSKISKSGKNNDYNSTSAVSVASIMSLAESEFDNFDTNHDHSRNISTNPVNVDVDVDVGVGVGVGSGKVAERLRKKGNVSLLRKRRGNVSVEGGIDDDSIVFDGVGVGVDSKSLPVIKSKDLISDIDTNTDTNTDTNSDTNINLTNSLSLSPMDYNVSALVASSLTAYTKQLDIPYEYRKTMQFSTIPVDTTSTTNNTNITSTINNNPTSASTTISSNTVNDSNNPNNSHNPNNPSNNSNNPSNSNSPSVDNGHFIQISFEYPGKEYNPDVDTSTDGVDDVGVGVGKIPSIIMNMTQPLTSSTITSINQHISDAMNTRIGTPFFVLPETGVGVGGVGVCSGSVGVGISEKVEIEHLFPKLVDIKEGSIKVDSETIENTNIDCTIEDLRLPVTSSDDRYLPHVTLPQFINDKWINIVNKLCLYPQTNSLRLYAQGLDTVKKHRERAKLASKEKIEELSSNLTSLHGFEREVDDSNPFDVDGDYDFM